MKKYSMAAIIGCAILSVVPASASNSSFVFTNGVSSNPYATANGVTVNMYAFDVAGTSAGLGRANSLRLQSEFTARTA